MGGFQVDSLPVFSLEGVCGLVSGQVSISGTRVHPSHVLMVHRGFFICLVCGYGAGSKAVGLSKMCPGQCSAVRRSLVRRIQRGVLPYHLTEWPKPVVPAPVWLEV